MTDEELYEWVESRIPLSVDRYNAEISTKLGEFESAMFDLVEEAAMAKLLPETVISMLRDEYPDGDYRAVLEGIFDLAK